MIGGEPARDAGSGASRAPRAARRGRGMTGRRAAVAARRRGARADAGRVRRRLADQRHDEHQAASRSCRGGPPGPRRRRSTPSSPRSASRTRASTPSTARSPAAPARTRSSRSRSVCSTVTRLTSGRRSPASRSRATRAAAWSAASRRSSTSEDLAARMNPTILRSVMRGGQPYGVPTGAHRSNVLWFNKQLLEQAGRHPSGERLHPRRVPRRPREGQGLRGDAAVPRRQGPLHHGRAVREHAAELDRDPAAGRTWSTTTSTGAATGCRQH